MPKQLPRMVLAELRLLLSRGTGFAGLVVAALVAVAAVAALRLMLEAQGGLTVNQQPASQLISFDVATALDWSLRVRNFFVMPLILLTLTAQSLAGEWKGRTLRAAVLRPVPRWSVLLAKFAALWIYASASLFLTFSVTALGAFAMFPAAAALSPVVAGFAAAALTDAGLIAFGLSVCTFLRSVPMVIVGTIIFLMGDMALRLALRGAAAFGLSGGEDVVRLMPGNALGAWSGFQDGWDPAAFVGLAILTLGCGVIAMWRFTRADIP